MTGPRTDNLARRLGVVFGVAIMVSVGAFSRIPAMKGAFGADVSFLAGPTGELDVTPTGVFVEGLDLRPGSARRPADGTLVVRNQTGSTLAIRVRALPSVNDLDGLLQLHVSAGATVVYEGDLRGLREWSRAFVLSAGESQPLHVSAWIRHEARTGYQSRVDEVTLQFDAGVA